jgi:hypothetical protein
MSETRRTEGLLPVSVPSRAPARALPPAMEARKWQKGQSGNPSGKGGLYHEVQRLARDASPEAMKKMIALMDCDDPRVAYMAPNTVMERAWGRAREYDPAADPESRPVLDVGS